MKNSRIDYTLVGALFALCIFIAMTVFLGGYVTEGLNATTPEEPKEQRPQSVDLNRREDLWVKLLGYTYDPNTVSLFNGEPEPEEGESYPQPSGDGRVVRKTYTYDESSNCVKLPYGGFMRNDTDEDMSYLLEQAGKLPDITSTSPQEPLVLIMHTHTTECYMKEASDSYSSETPQRSTDLSETVVAAGEIIAEMLAEYGISSVHDQTVHDYPAYTGAYDRSQETVIDYLERYPSIQIVIDVHRDAIEAEGIRYAPVAEINGRSAAQVMIIVGNHNVPRFRYNLRLASLLQGKMESLYPGLTRPLLVADRNYNQDLTKGSILVEMGASANSFDEAMYAAELVGISLAQLLGDIL